MMSQGDSYTSFTTENNHNYVLRQVAPVTDSKSCSRDTDLPADLV